MALSSEQARANAYKANQTRRKKLTLKQKRFTKEIVKTLNGTQSALIAYDVKNEASAATVASELLSKPKIKLEIERLLNVNGIKIEEILTFHRRNMVQDINYPTSQKAIGDFYELLGMKVQEKATTDVKIAFVIEK